MATVHGLTKNNTAAMRLGMNRYHSFSIIMLPLCGWDFSVGLTCLGFLFDV